jgi:transposase
MSGYSLDLRERIVSSKAEGHTLEWVAQTFGVNVSTVKRYLARYRQTGSVAPTVQQKTTTTSAQGLC